MSRNIPLNQIKPNPDQPRQHFGQVELEELATSIKVQGLLVPITVRPKDGGYEIVCGERRWRAAELAGLDTIRAEVQEMSDREAYLTSLVENVQRANLSPIEEAEAFRKLSERMTQAEIGRLIGKSQQYVADRLALLKLTDEVQNLVTARAVNPSMGRRLVGIDDPGLQIELARRAAEGDLTVRQIEDVKRNPEQAASYLALLEVRQTLEAQLGRPPSDEELTSVLHWWTGDWLNYGEKVFGLRLDREEGIPILRAGDGRVVLVFTSKGPVSIKPWPELREILPALSRRERGLLAQSIEEFGVMEPVIILSDGRIIDGHARWELSGGKVPIRVWDMEEDEAFEWGIELNLTRRHLSPEQTLEAQEKGATGGTVVIT